MHWWQIVLIIFVLSMMVSYSCYKYSLWEDRKHRFNRIEWRKEYEKGGQ